jgi:hypothetical protein
MAVHVDCDLEDIHVGDAGIFNHHGWVGSSSTPKG